MLLERQELMTSFITFKAINSSALQDKEAALQLFKKELRIVTDDNAKMKA